MARSTRRAFLEQFGAAAIVSSGFRRDAGAFPVVATGQDRASEQTYDLLIAGGRVIDPGQDLSAVRDIAIAHGRIARVDVNIRGFRLAECSTRRIRS